MLAALTRPSSTTRWCHLRTLPRPFDADNLPAGCNDDAAGGYRFTTYELHDTITATPACVSDSAAFAAEELLMHAATAPPSVCGGGAGEGATHPGPTRPVAWRPRSKSATPAASPAPSPPTARRSPRTRRPCTSAAITGLRLCTTAELNAAGCRSDACGYDELACGRAPTDAPHRRRRPRRRRRHRPRRPRRHPAALAAAAVAARQKGALATALRAAGHGHRRRPAAARRL